MCQQIIFICIRNKKGEVKWQRFITNENIRIVTLPESRYWQASRGGPTERKVSQDYFSVVYKYVGSVLR